MGFTANVIVLLLFSVDVWSVGCIMAELLSSEALFPGNDRIFSNAITFTQEKLTG